MDGCWRTKCLHALPAQQCLRSFRSGQCLSHCVWQGMALRGHPLHLPQTWAAAHMRMRAGLCGQPAVEKGQLHTSFLCITAGGPHHVVLGACSDVCSNAIRVIKTSKQTSKEAVTYPQLAQVSEVLTWQRAAERTAGVHACMHGVHLQHWW